MQLLFNWRIYLKPNSENWNGISKWETEWNSDVREENIRADSSLSVKNDNYSAGEENNFSPEVNDILDATKTAIEFGNVSKTLDFIEEAQIRLNTEIRLLE